MTEALRAARLLLRPGNGGEDPIVLAPGHVYANDWRPSDVPDEGRWHMFLTGGVGRRPS